MNELKLAIKNCKINSNQKQTVLINDGKIIDILPCNVELDDFEILDANGLYISPSLIDMHCHLREPGFTQKEDIVTGTTAALYGGFSTILAMANTNPVIDDVEKYIYMQKQYLQRAKINVLQVVSATINMNGIELTDFKKLKQAGVIAISDDGKPIVNPNLTKKAMEEARANSLVLISHCEDINFCEGAVNEAIAKTLGVNGVSPLAEELSAARDILISIDYNLPIHLAHISSKNTVALVRMAKSLGAPVTAETCPHYFSLTQNAVLNDLSNAKMNPPLKTEADRVAIIEGIKDGTIDAISTDHAPHTDAEKGQGLEASPNGIIGFETALPLAITYLHKKENIPLCDVMDKFTKNPAKILSLNNGVLEKGRVADLILFDIDNEYKIDKSTFKSKSKNTPFDGFSVFGKVKYNILKGEINGPFN